MKRNGAEQTWDLTYLDLSGLRRFLARCARWLGLGTPRQTPAATHAATMAVDAAHEAQIASARAILVLIEEVMTLIDLMEQTYAEAWPTARQSEAGAFMCDELRPELVEFADDIRRDLANNVGADSTDCEQLTMNALRTTYALLDRVESDLAEM